MAAQQSRGLKRYTQILFTALIALSSLKCTESRKAQSVDPWLSFNWPAADSLFLHDNYWIGGDGAYSIDLGDERVLWLFGDSWIDSTGNRNRQNAVMVSNTLAIQRGYDPSRASIKFFWNQNPGKTESYFPDNDAVRYWPGHGIRVGDKLLLFLMGVYASDKGLGFDVKDWKPLLILNPDDDPDRWEIEYLEAKSNNLQIIVGSGGVLQWENFIYAFGAQELESKHDIYLVRWSIENIIEGQLDLMQWWGGDQLGWINTDARINSAVPVFNKGQTEFTVHYDEKESVFVEIQTEGFGSANIVRRNATSIAGPWSDPEIIFSPAQFQFPNIMIYQGKAHPYLLGAFPVVTYCTNSFEFADHLREDWLYYPRFVRIK
jgi:hypothetical protein